MNTLARRVLATATTVGLTLGLAVAGASGAVAYQPSQQNLFVASNAASCNKNPCVLYPKSAQLPSGRLVATFEDSESAVVGQKLPVYKSDDFGTTWQKLTDVPAPAFASTDPQYVKYTSNWTNAYLYTLPEAVGSLAAGTVLLASVVSGDDAYYNEQKAANPAWKPTGDGDRKDLAIALYSSTTDGASWKFENIIAAGGWQGGSAGAVGRTSAENATKQVDPLWEPHLLVYNGQLVAYYSDENDYLGMDTTTGGPTLDPANDTAADSGGQILVHRTWNGTSAAWSQPVVDVAGLTVNRGNGKTQIGGGRPGMETVVPTTDGKWLMTFEYFGGGDNVHFKIANDPLSFSTAGGAVGTNISTLPVASGPKLSVGGSPVLINLPDGRLVYNAAGSGNVWVNESGRSDGTWKAYQTSMPSGYSRNLQYVNGTGRILILQAAWAGGSVGPVKYAEVDLGKSAGSYYNLVNRKTGQVLSPENNKTQDPPFTGNTPDLLSWTATPGNDSQRWHVVAKGGAVTFLNKAGGRSVGIWQGSAVAGQRVTQWVDDNGADKLWNLIPTTDGYYKIQSTKNTSVFITGAVADAAVTLQSATTDGSQEWQLAEEAPTPTDLTIDTHAATLIGEDPVGVGATIALDAGTPGGTARHANSIGHAYLFTGTDPAVSLGLVTFDADEKGSLTLPDTVSEGSSFRIAVTFDDTALLWDSSIVTSKVIAPTMQVTSSATTRCVASKVVITGTVTNNNEVPADVQIGSNFGAKAFTAIGPGKSASVAFTTRLSTVPAGQITVSATAVIDSQTVTTQQTASYAARTC